MAQDYTQVGEYWGFCKWNLDKGELIGYEPKFSMEGNLLIQKDGTPAHDVIMTGDFDVERAHGFNVLTDPGARSWEECRWVCNRRMVPTKDLQRQFRGDKDKLALITESSNATYKLFDGSNGSYGKNQGLTLVMEFYFRPDRANPNGRYYMVTETGTLHDQELPLGIFPVIFFGWDEQSTSARCVSHIKQIRPCQAEINRAASKMAEHQIKLGDDKIITQQGTSISEGGTAYGVKHVKVNGPPPTILQGRTGEQYVNYVRMNIEEMYQISNLDEDKMETNNLDPYSMLFRAIKDKKKFTIYTDKFEDALIELCEMCLEFKKAYLRDEELIPVVGRKENVNIAEFRTVGKMSNEIKVEAQTEDVESKLGRQIAFNHIMQYASPNMKPEDVGKIIRQMPYANQEEVFNDLTIDYDNANNDILALDRGEYVGAELYDNHEYMIKRLVNRMKQADFKTLPPQVQEMYTNKKMEHEQAIAILRQQEIMDNAGFIPTTGGLITCNFYIPKPGDTEGKTQLARLPYDALNWLVQKLQSQGVSLNEFNELPPESQANIVQLAQTPPQGEPEMSMPDQAMVM